MLRRDLSQRHGLPFRVAPSVLVYRTAMRFYLCTRRIPSYYFYFYFYFYFIFCIVFLFYILHCFPPVMRGTLSLSLFSWIPIGAHAPFSLLRPLILLFCYFLIVYCIMGPALMARIPATGSSLSLSILFGYMLPYRYSATTGNSPTNCSH